MKNTLLILTIAFCFSCDTPQEKEQVIITPAEEQIAKDLIQGVFDDIWAAADSTKLLDYHTADFVLLEHGEVWDNETIMDYMRRQNARENRPVRTNRMEYLWVDKYGESIQLGYHNYADFIEGDSVVFKGQWLESALAVPTENGWRLKMMHSTRVRRE